MNASPVTRIVEHRARRPRAAERPVVADINPRAPDSGLAARQHRHGGVIAMHTLGREHHGFDMPERRFQSDASGPDQISQGRDAERHTLAGKALGLAVERLVLAEFLIGDHRQQAGAGEGARNDVERRRSLADRLAIAAGEFLPHIRWSLNLRSSRPLPPRTSCAPSRKPRRAAPPLSPASPASARRANPSPIIVTPRHMRKHRPRRLRFSHNPKLLFQPPATATLNPRYDLIQTVPRS